MIGFEDSQYTYEYDDYFKILPAINNWSEDTNRIGNGKKVAEGFTYSSDSNNDWMKSSELEKWLDTNKEKIGKI